MVIKILLYILHPVLIVSACSFIPLLLFLLPKTRNSSSWRIRMWKCIPAGFSCGYLFLFFAEKIMERSFLSLSLPHGVILLFSAILLTVFVTLFLWCRMKKSLVSPEEEPQKKEETLWQKIKFYNVRIGYIFTIYIANLFLVLGMTFPLLLLDTAIYCFFSDDYRNAQKWDRKIKADTVPAATLEARSIHPFLAEYDYRLCFDTPKGKERHYLHCNPGGKIHFKIWKLKDGRFLWKDKFCSYIVDHRTGKVWRLMKDSKGILYYALIPNELEEYFGGVEFDWKNVEFTRNGKILKHEKVGDLLEGKTFAGSIDSRHGIKFYPGGEDLAL